MTKTEAVQKEMIAAMKHKDKERKESLTLLLSALKAKAKDKHCLLYTSMFRMSLLIILSI